MCAKHKVFFVGRRYFELSADRNGCAGRVVGSLAYEPGVVYCAQYQQYQGALLLAMLDENQFPELPGAAVLVVEPVDENIQYCNGTAEELLGTDAADLVGKPWWQALGVARESDQGLPRAIASGIRTAILPTLLCPGSSGELVVGGYLFPQLNQGKK